VTECSICQKNSGLVERPRHETRGGRAREGVGVEEAAMPPSQKILDFFSFQNSAFWCIFDDFSYTKSKVLFAIKRKERYVITAFLAIDGDTDIKRQVFINFVNLSQ